MKYLSVADILDIWGNIFGKDVLPGVRSYDLLESAVNKPKASFGGYDLYEGVITKAVVLCEAIIKNHPFIDGNKRVGVMAMLTFLERNGYNTSKIPDDVLYDVAVGFAKGSLEREEAVSILERFLLEHIEDYASYVEEALSEYTKTLSRQKNVRNSGMVFVNAWDTIT